MTSRTWRRSWPARARHSSAARWSTSAEGPCADEYRADECRADECRADECRAGRQKDGADAVVTPDDLRGQVRDFLTAHDPASTDRLEFLRARFDAGLAWVR